MSAQISSGVAGAELVAHIGGRVSALKLSEPGPTPTHLREILQAGVAAPDHGRLAPWRFIVVEGAGRERLGDFFARATAAQAPDIPAAQLERERQKVFRAPTIIVAAASVQEHPKVPAIEQIVAVGAAVENMFLAATALGYGAMWRTGSHAYDPLVKEALGLRRADCIVAFLYLGTIQVPGQRRAHQLDQPILRHL
jgi:nitroreductase